MKIFIVGSGRLAGQTAERLKKHRHTVTHVQPSELTAPGDASIDESPMDFIEDALLQAGLGPSDTAVFVDKLDRVNMLLTIATLAIGYKKPITIALFNESLGQHFSELHRNVTVYNPAGVASPTFVEALWERREQKKLHSRTYNPPIVTPRKDGLTTKLAVAFLATAILGTIFFRITESVSWVDSAYLMISVITSVNFSDANIVNNSEFVKAERMALIIATYSAMIFMFSFFIGKIIERHTEQLMFGKKRCRYSGHVIICGLGQSGFRITEELVKRGKQVLVIESDASSTFLEVARSRGIDVYVGDALMPHVLVDAGIERAAGLMAVTSDDDSNLEVALNARSLNPRLRVILRIFDGEMAQAMKEHFGISFTYSISSIASEVIAKAVNKKLESLPNYTVPVIA